MYAFHVMDSLDVKEIEHKLITNKPLLDIAQHLTEWHDEMINNTKFKR